MANQKAKDNEQIPIRLWMRKYYTKITGEEAAKCNYCTLKLSINIKDYVKYHRHLVKEHPDKLTQNEKEEKKFGWFWDYFTPKNNMTTMCNFCHNIYKYHKLSNTNLIKHLKKYHRITISARTHGDDLNDTNMDTINANCQEDLESLSSNSFENMEGTNVHNRKSEATFEQKTEDNKQIPIRLWLCSHYTKLTGEEAAKCNYCISKFSINIKDYGKFHRHLVEKHPNKLTKNEKKEKKFGWFWDYFIPNNNMTAICKFCRIICKYHKDSNANLITHLKKCHRITISARTHGDRDDLNDTNMDTKINANHLEDSERLSSNSFENTEITNVHNRKSEATFEKKTKNNKQIPIRHSIRRHYTKLTGEKAAKCNYCITKFSINTKDYAKYHRHLVKKHTEKLTQNEKEEEKFGWFWDYFKSNNNMTAMCNICHIICKYHKLSNAHLITHLKKRHRITINTRTHGDRDDLNDTNMDTINANCQEDLESLSSNSFENMERKNVHNRKSKATIEQKTEDDKQIPIRLWIGRHFTKLTGEESKCNYCILKFFIYDNDNDYEKFQCHLVKEHPDKLADDKKEKDKFSWIWDYYTLENNIHAMCNFCGNNIKLYNKSEYTLETHLKVYHGITGADSNTDDASNDANKDTDLCKNTENTGSQIAKRFGAKTYNAILAYDDGNLPYVRLQRL